MNDSGKRYDLMVDWEKRLANEMPFLLELLETRKADTVLDVGCGTGRHIKSLFEAGYKTAGIDADKSKIELARNLVPEAELTPADFLEKSSLENKKFDFVYSLGNSVGLMASSAGYEKIIRRFSEIVTDNGILVFHTLNFEKERNSWSLPRALTTEEGEFIFLRRFATSDKFLCPEIVTLHRKTQAGNWEMTVSSPVNIPRISKNKMEDLLKANCFGNIKVYGDYRKTPFNKDAVDMIWVTEKSPEGN